MVKKVPERSEVAAEYKWNLSDVYPGDASFEEDFTDLERRIPELNGYKGKLGESADTLLTFFNLREDIFIKYERAISYARLKRDEDSRISQYQGYFNRALDLGGKMSQALSWFSPELLCIPWERLEAWMAENEELAVYRHYLEDAFRVKEHILTPESEYVLALATNLSGDPGNIFHAFNDADIGGLFPVIKDDEGREFQLSHARYQAILETGSPHLRREAFKGLFGAYQKFGNTLAALLKTQVDRDIFFAKSRRYDSALEYALSDDNVPVEVYTNLIETVRNNLGVVHRYMALRKRILELEEMHLYDTHIPLFPDVSETFSYERGKAMILESLKPLGEGYAENVETAFKSGWIDVLENAGKCSGAYSWGAYPIHPYMLLNYSETLNDVFTAAHEMGHTMHTHYTINNQPFIYGDYSIFTAEVASTMNEALLMDYLLKSTEDRRKKLNLLAQYMSNITGTVVVQTFFAEFELEIHRSAEAGEPLTSETLSEIYFALLKEYYGDSLVYNEEYRYNWCRIPHFWRNFYVYKYATSFSASTALSQMILAGESSARTAYLRFLSSGSSDYPINLLKKAGVDMTNPEPVVRTMKLYADLIDEMETVYREL